MGKRPPVHAEGAQGRALLLRHSFPPYLVAMRRGGVTEAGCTVGSIHYGPSGGVRATTRAASGPTPRRVAEAKEVWKGRPTK